MSYTPYFSQKIFFVRKSGWFAAFEAALERMRQEIIWCWDFFCVKRD